LPKLTGYPNVARLGDWRSGAGAEGPDLLVPLKISVGRSELSLFTTMTVFGTPHGVTVAELAVELFYPAGSASEAVLRAMAGPGGGG
jgi:hypothetical protein